MNSSEEPGSITLLSHKEPIGLAVMDFRDSNLPSASKSCHISSKASLQVRSAQEVRWLGSMGLSIPKLKFPKFSSNSSSCSEENLINTFVLFTL